MALLLSSMLPFVRGTGLWLAGLGKCGGPKVNKQKSKGATGPPVVLVVVALVVLSFAFVMAYKGGPGPNLLGFIVGSILGTGNLAGYLVWENKRKAGKKFGDWPFFRARSAVKYIALTSWALGGWNIFFWALDVTRGA